MKVLEQVSLHEWLSSKKTFVTHWVHKEEVGFIIIGELIDEGDGCPS